MKKHLYFVPGTAASPKIFERLQLPEDQFELHFLEWFLPESKKETIESYAKRMCQLVKHEKPVLIGVSFGGILVQEMSKIIPCEKVVLISSVKNKDELSSRLKIVKFLKAYKLFPSSHISNIETILVKLFGAKAKKRIKMYQMYLSVREPLFLNWALKQAVIWPQKETLKGMLHIHGTTDPIFPIKYIKNCIRIKNGSHIMIITKAKEISSILVKKLL
ncbi:alpha/beta hydrolase family protein [Flavicella sediminum]|uniref:alpha/beta hydrolase n=1 Tax=Flavicella sediminum TaxID=2585141 RepID=UPI00111E0D0C|nr:alpha/beta hydrolase [Flavicella sediminum]